MSTDIEQRIRAGLADAPTPAALRLDADTVTRVAARSHRRRRTGQALLGGMASLAVVGSLTWAGGWLPDGVQRALPASPWSSCPISGPPSGETSLRLASFDHAVIPLSEGGTVVVGLGQGCPGGDVLLMAAAPESPDALPGTLPFQGGIGAGPDPHLDALTEWRQGLQLPDGRRVTGVLVPASAEHLVSVGPDGLHEPSTESVPVPATDYAAFVLEDYWPDGEDLAQVWRGADGLVHTSWSAGITARAWQGEDPAAELTDTWVGQDRQEQQWVMRGGQVRGPFELSDEPYAVAFPTGDPALVEVVVVVPEGGGELHLSGGQQGSAADSAPPETVWLDSSEGDRTLHAGLVRLEPVAAGGLPALEWVPGGEGERAQPVPFLEP